MGCEDTRGDHMSQGEPSSRLTPSRPSLSAGGLRSHDSPWFRGLQQSSQKLDELEKVSLAGSAEGVELMAEKGPVTPGAAASEELGLA